jgi:branched-chain amino acid transport system ATP-binding protein
VIDGQVTFAPMTVRENLELGSRALGRAPNSGTLAEVYTLFPVLQNRQAQRAGTLSGGEKKMLAIGRALMAEPTVLILDEATAGLAPRIINEIGDALRALSAGGLTLLLAEQSLQLPSRLGGRAVLMERGLFTWSGLAASLKSEQRVVEAVLGHGIVDVGAEPGFTQTV